MREWPVPKQCTSPPPAIASAQIRLAWSTAADWLSRRSRSARAAARKALGSPPMATDSPATGGHRVTMLGTGLIGLFYTRTLHGRRNRDRVGVVYSRTEERARAFAESEGVPEWTTDLVAAIAHPATDTVVVGLPNDLHEDVIRLAADAGKAVLCTKPLARTGAEA